MTGCFNVRWYENGNTEAAATQNCLLRWLRMANAYAMHLSLGYLPIISKAINGILTLASRQQHTCNKHKSN